MRAPTSMSGEFVDTNVLIYAHDATAGVKRDRAVALLDQLGAERRGLLSTQVLMEFYVTVTRKLPRRLDHRVAAAIVEDFGSWTVFRPGVDDLVAAANLSQRHRIHPFDALIVRSALVLEATTLWSEDLHDGQKIDGLSIRNPFKG